MKLECSRCGKTKDVKPNVSYCKACAKEYRHSQSAETKKRYQLREKHGISLEEFERLWEYQHGRCKICDVKLTRQHLKKTTAQVDHCHSTGKIRGLLCWRCNIGLGHFEDQLERLIAAALYVSGEL